MILTITGHRPQRLKGQERLIKKWAEEQLIRLHPSMIYNGMAQGVDQIVAIAAKELNMPIICCYPFFKTTFHPIEEWIMENNIVIFTSSAFSKQSYIIRDKYMVDHSDIVLAVWDGIRQGGTYITREYAIKQGKKVIDYEGLKI